MYESLYSKLPWFIKKRIISLVVLVQPSYGSVCKEWLQCLVKQYGIIQFYANAWHPDETKEKPFISKYAETIAFRQSEPVDWDFIYSINNIEEIIISFRYHDELTPELKDNLSKISTIKRMIFKFTDNETDIDPFITNHQNTLTELAIDYRPKYSTLYLKNMIFPNLVSLKLCNFNESFMNNLSNTMPKLKILHLVINDPDISIFPPYHVDSLNIEELSLAIFQFGKMDLLFSDPDSINQIESVKLDLNKLPNIKKLLLQDKIELINKNMNHPIQELTINLAKEFEDNLLNSTFNNLKKLYINVNGQLNSNLINFILSCPKLTSLQLYSEKDITFEENLPIGIFSVTTLRLGGQFIYCSEFISWLAIHFKLHHLELDFNYIQITPNFHDLNLPHFKHLIAAGEPGKRTWINDHINYNVYPHAELIEVVNCFEGIFHSENFFRVNL